MSPVIINQIEAEGQLSLTLMNRRHFLRRKGKLELVVKPPIWYILISLLGGTYLLTYYVGTYFVVVVIVLVGGRLNI